MPSTWFDYPIRVQPHHTDYSGVVWHGTYMTWLESARVECLRAVGAPFDSFVNLGYDLPVVALDIRYRRSLTLGMAATVKTRLAPSQGIRINWRYEIESAPDDLTVKPLLCLSAQVTLVPVRMSDRKVVRHLPIEIRDLLTKVADYFEPS
ncbi:MAG: thioesterase family protein [Phormidesmis sp.]